MTKLTDEEKKEKSRIAAKKYRETHKDKIKADQKKIREKNKEKNKQYSKKYYLKNKEKFQEESKSYYEENREIILEKSSKYYEENKETKIKQYIENHKLEKSVYNKQYAKINKEKLKKYYDERNKTLKGRFSILKSASKKRNKELAITFDQYSEEVIKPCFYCQDYFRKNEVGTGCGLDRVDNTKGYLIDNIVSCCAHCNYLKGEIYSQSQTIAMVNALIALEK